MQPGMALRYRSMGQQGIARPVTASTGKAPLWRRCRRMTVHPFADAASNRLGLRFRAWKASVELEAAKHPKSFVSLDDADHLLTRTADAEYVARVLAAWAARYV